MSGKLLVFRVDFNYIKDNAFCFTEKIAVGFRFSLWKDNSNFTAGEIVEISNNDFLKPGRNYDMIIKLIYSNVSSELQINDSAFIGVPYKEIGTVKIVEQLEM